MAAKASKSIPSVLDVTLRDGGYVNKHSWSLGDAIRIVEAAGSAGIPAVEIGYFRPRRHAVDGDIRPAASCPTVYVERLRESAPNVEITVMAHQKDVEPRHYRDLAARGVAVVRLPTKISAIDQAGAHVAAIHEAGMRATINIIRISELSLSEVARTAAAADTASPDVLYLADSNGSLFPEEVGELIQVVQKETERPVGFHAHDGLSLAFSNSLAALEAGCTYLDASLSGMGKGGGNLCLELISGYLRARRKAALDIAPLARTTEEVLAPWRGGGSIARCESIVSSLLNLNLDEIAGLRGATEADLLTLLDQPWQPQPALPA